MQAEHGQMIARALVRHPRPVLLLLAQLATQPCHLLQLAQPHPPLAHVILTSMDQAPVQVTPALQAVGPQAMRCNLLNRTTATMLHQRLSAVFLWCQLVRQQGQVCCVLLCTLAV